MDSLNEQLNKTKAFIQSKSKIKPRVGLVLGSGLGAFVKFVKSETSIAFNEIPGFSKTTVPGHHGHLILGHIHDLPIAVLQGRVHYYEGLSMDQVVFPTRTLIALGIETLVLTNSAGGLNPDMKPGDLMILTDHINLMGDNPLRGPNLDQLGPLSGPRFPDMTAAYDPELADLAEKILKQLGLRHHKGIYCAMSGPTYETPAEVNFLAKIGANAVGMSTAPETIAARHLGIKVCALSCISNQAAGLSSEPLSHDDVTRVAKATEQSFCQVLSMFFQALSSTFSKT